MIKKILNNFKYLVDRSEFIKGSYLLNFAEYLILPKKEQVLYHPLQLTCYITDTCTLNCNFCPHHSMYRNRDYPYLHNPLENMTLPNFERIIDLIPHTPRISLCGVGEPFLNRDIYNMIDYAIKRKKLVLIITNGTLLKDHIDEIVKRKIFGINISLNCTNQDEFRKLTNSTAHEFDEIVSNIQELIHKAKKNNIKTSLSFVVSRSRLHDIEKTLAYVNDTFRGISKVMFHNMIYFGIEGEYSLEEVMTESDLEVKTFLQNIKKDFEKYPFEIELPKLKPLDSHEILCNDFFTQMHVDSNGNVSGCGKSIAPSPDFGNILKEGAEVWNNPFFKKMRKMSISKEFSGNPVCKHCVGS